MAERAPAALAALGASLGLLGSMLLDNHRRRLSAEAALQKLDCDSAAAATVQRAWRAWRFRRRVSARAAAAAVASSAAAEVCALHLQRLWRGRLARRRFRVRQHRMTVAAAFHSAKTARIAGLDCVDEWHWKGEQHAVHKWKLPRSLQAGDIVLFQYSSVGNAVVRAVIGSEWDHVAMVLGGGRRSLYLLEATMDGVSTFPLLRQLQRYLTICSRIVVRLLHVERSPAMLSALGKFARRADGLPYSLSPRKLLSGSSSPSSSSPSSSSPSSSREGDGGGRRQRGTPLSTSTEDDYFCSELVVDAYRAMGLVDPSWRGGYFWPRAFGAGGDIEQILLLGASLGGEMEADCCLFDELYRTCSRSAYHTVRRGGPDFPVVSKRVAALRRSR